MKGWHQFLSTENPASRVTGIGSRRALRCTRQILEGVK